MTVVLQCPDYQIGVDGTLDVYDENEWRDVLACTSGGEVYSFFASLGHKVLR